MPITLIKSNEEKRLVDSVVIDNNAILQVSEFFSDTLQGESVTSGVPSTFLRLKGCTLDCIWCDTSSVWREGHSYSSHELFKMMDEVGLPDRLKKGQHLILTGGSPLKQQNELVKFINTFIQVYGFKPFIEIENEAVLMPVSELIRFIDQWNNSPKLANSGMKLRARYKPLVLSYMSKLNNSWFKFVVNCEEDWEEIQMDFIDTDLVSKDQIILMPCGESQEQLAITRPIAAEMAIKYGVRFCDRLHITIWDKRTGV